MAYLTGTIDFQVYTDSSQTEFPQELVADISKEFSSTTITSAQPTTISLAASATQSISFNGVTSVKRFYIYSSATDITVNPNGLGALTCKSGTPGMVPFTVTSLSVTNTSSTTATTVTVVLIAE